MKFYSGGDVTMQKGYPHGSGLITSECFIFTPDKDGFRIYGILSSIEIDDINKKRAVSIATIAADKDGCMYLVKTSYGWDMGWIPRTDTISETWIYALAQEK